MLVFLVAATCHSHEYDTCTEARNEHGLTQSVVWQIMILDGLKTTTSRLVLQFLGVEKCEGLSLKMRMCLFPLITAVFVRPYVASQIHLARSSHIDMAENSTCRRRRGFQCYCAESAKTPPWYNILGRCPAGLGCLAIRLLIPVYRSLLTWCRS